MVYWLAGFLTLMGLWPGGSGPSAFSSCLSPLKRIEAGSEHDNLAHAAGDAGCQRLLGKPAARSDEQPHRPQRRVGRGFVKSGESFVVETLFEANGSLKITPLSSV
jgi:hypothetical protein